MLGSCTQASAAAEHADKPKFMLMLRQCRDEISDPACKSRVTKVKEVAASDIRFDIPLAEACYTDRQTFCANVQPGSARVIRCLQNRSVKPVFTMILLAHDDAISLHLFVHGCQQQCMRIATHGDTAYMTAFVVMLLGTLAAAQHVI